MLLGDTKGYITPKQTKELERLSLLPNPSDKQEKELERLRSLKVRNGEPVFSKSAESMLLNIYFSKKYNKRYIPKIEKEDYEQDGIPQMVRGIKCEEDGAKLLSELDNVTYYKDKKVRQNDYFTGAFDRIDAPTIEEATKIVEIKVPYGYKEFYKQMGANLPKHIVPEMQGYLDITGKNVGEVHFCLVSFPEQTIQQQRLYLLNKMCPNMVETEDFLEKWAEIEDNMRFSDIEPSERVWSYRIERDDELIDEMKARVEQARRWLSDFEKTHKTATSLRWHHLF